MKVEKMNFGNLIETKKINLQLFAEGEDDLDEEIEDAMDIEDDEEDPEDIGDDPEDLADDLDEDHSEDDEEDPDEDEEDNENPPKEKDKVTAALIKEKKARKKLEKALKDAEERANKAERKKREEAQVESLIEKGYGEDHAKTIVQQQSEVESLRREINLMRFESLEGKHPGISNYANEIMDLKEKTGLSIEEIYNAKYRSLSEFDIKTKAEQETLYRRSKAKEKKGIEGSSKGVKKKTTLSIEDERAYKLLRQSKQFKNMTREDYKKLSEMDEL